MSEGVIDTDEVVLEIKGAIKTKQITN